VDAILREKYIGLDGWEKLRGLEDEMKRFYQFWDCFTTVLTIPRVHTFCTGKQTAFSLIGLGV
jgi:hypothetical protein